jgi:uncharacterized protein YbjT (DUF2867 family)
MTKIAVAGATGRLGRHLVDVLQERGHETVPMSRATGVDVITGEGLDAALEGVDAIVDSATGPSPDEEEATRFFTASAANLQAAAERAGVERIVTVSIIGTDHFEGGYGAAKMAHEKFAQAGPVPGRIVRAAQFHEFVEELLGWGLQGDVSRMPSMRTQLVSARALAEVIADVATAPEATGPTVEVAGPREENLVEAARLLVERRGDGITVEVATGDEDPYASVNQSGALLPGPDAILAGPTYAEWLEANVPEPSRAA